ncbi:hypothetical protein GCM10011409_39360 [Lentibacillus populi]|uniref:Uncharacterized protein n=1 Tax=Lentibacillus populi TaxID=1827502 RepID=A0A9W5U132_9BACI|nr:hypothetical protein GCM10011409_39360 [Lentibacillus populi]
MHAIPYTRIQGNSSIIILNLTLLPLHISLPVKKQQGLRTTWREPKSIPTKQEHPQRIAFLIDRLALGQNN